MQATQAVSGHRRSRSEGPVTRSPAPAPAPAPAPSYQSGAALAPHPAPCTCITCHSEPITSAVNEPALSFTLPRPGEVPYYIATRALSLLEAPIILFNIYKHIMPNRQYRHLNTVRTADVKLGYLCAKITTKRWFGLQKSIGYVPSSRGLLWSLRNVARVCLQLYWSPMTYDPPLCPVVPRPWVRVPAAVRRDGAQPAQEQPQEAGGGPGPPGH